MKTSDRQEKKEQREEHIWQALSNFGGSFTSNVLLFIGVGFTPGVLFVELINLFGGYFLEKTKLIWLSILLLLFGCALAFYGAKLFADKKGEDDSFFYYMMWSFFCAFILLFFSMTDVHGIGLVYIFYMPFNVCLL